MYIIKYRVGEFVYYSLFLSLILLQVLCNLKCTVIHESVIKIKKLLTPIPNKITFN